jgi:hypothetical protein
LQPKSFNVLYFSTRSAVRTRYKRSRHVFSDEEESEREECILAVSKLY